LKPCEYIEEENYFFKLTAFEDFLKNLYRNNPEFVTPQTRFNEVKSFVEEGLEDFSISREGASFGIPFPFDPNHVVYVWYDALFNYYTVTLDDNLNELGYFGDEIYHVIGKDIAKFHAIYWPAMLEAVDLSKPRKIFTTGFFTVDGQKMSKSL
jgi:methionyl-tRNA synthetase